MINTNILQKIEKNAFIIRKYNLGDESYFYSKFPVASKTVLEIIWEKEKKKVQNKEIIKNSNELNATELNFVNKRFLQFESSTEKLYDYLISEFDYKKLKLDEENIERRLRNLLSEKFIELSSKEIPKEIKKDDEIRREKKKIKESRIINSVVVIAIFSFLFGSAVYDLGLTVYDGFTPVKQLTERIHERSKYKFSGSICNDGTTSHSQGRGTCSWHKGVNYEFYEGDYAKSIEECKTEAVKLSWIDNFFTKNPFTEQNWVGEVKKINSDEVWTTRINCKSENEISLYYPNTGCSGILQKIKKTDSKISFREKLQTGNEICTNNGKVIIEIGERDLIFYYCWPNDNVIVAKGILKKEE
jgi:hypothetical protein